MATLTATITSGTALTAAIDLGGLGLTRILMPAAWTSAVLTIQVSEDGTTFDDLYDEDGNEWAATVAASHAIAIDPSIFNAAHYLKIRSGTGGSPVTQGADRVLTLITRPL